MERVMEHSIKHSMERSVERSMERSIERSIKRSMERHIEHSIGRSMGHLMERSMERSLECSTERSMECSMELRSASWPILFISATGCSYGQGVYHYRAIHRREARAGMRYLYAQWVHCAGYAGRTAKGYDTWMDE